MTAGVGALAGSANRIITRGFDGHWDELEPLELPPAAAVVVGDNHDAARAVWAALTEEGQATLECVRVEHTELLRSLFRGALTDDEVAQLSELLGRLPGVGAGSCAG